MEALEKGNHLIIWGNTLDALSSKIPDSSVDLIFGAPPYNIGKSFNGRKDKWISEEACLEWCYRWIDLCLLKLKDRGSFYLTWLPPKICPTLTFTSGIKSAFFPVLFGSTIVRGPSEKILRFSV